jgi:hypothetical protein
MTTEKSASTTGWIIASIGPTAWPLRSVGPLQSF